MSGLFYAVFVVAILFIIRWYDQNESEGPDPDGGKGLLAMSMARTTQPESSGRAQKDREKRIAPGSKRAR